MFLSQKFIQGTLENGPASDSDEQDGENRKESLSFIASTSSDPPATETDYGSSSVKHAPAEMNQSFACDPFDTSSFEVSITDDDLPDLILHFAEPNDFERLVSLCLFRFLDWWLLTTKKYLADIG